MAAFFAQDPDPAGGYEQNGQNHQRAGEIAEHFGNPKTAHADQSKGQKAQGKTPESAVPLVGLHIGRQPVGCRAGANVGSGIDRGRQKNRRKQGVGKQNPVLEGQGAEHGNHRGRAALFLED